MDIKFYEDLYDALVEHNAHSAQNYGNTIAHYPPTNPAYPLTVFREERNVANPNYNGDLQKVSSVLYSVTVCAKTKGSTRKDVIARRCFEIADELLSSVGLRRVSYNVFDIQDDGNIYMITSTYSGNFDEYRRRIL
jgi:hypothetical protein